MTNEWIEHDGGKCPVDGNTLVDVVIFDEYYNEKIEEFGKTANTFDWHDCYGKEIYLQKYRLSKEQT